LAGSKTSARQRGQVGRSGGIETRGAALGSLAAIEKATSGAGGIGRHSMRSIAAAAGGVSSRRRKASSERGSPWASMVTPPPSLRTQPPMPSSRASR